MRRRPSVDQCVGVDERQILCLPRREQGSRRGLLTIHRRPRQWGSTMNIRYRVGPRATMAMLSGGKHAARKLKRAQILLAAEAGVGDEEIARSVSVGGSTVYRT